MRKENGITLISLIIYIIILTVVMSILAIVAESFFSNTEYITDTGKYTSEINKFNMYFVEDVKKNKEIYSINSREVVFANGTVYTNRDKGIYRNKTKICDNVYYCRFSKSTDTESKTAIKVTIIMDSPKYFSVDNEYVLKYW